MTQPDRAAIDAMTKALDAVFGRRTPRYVKGDQIDDIPLGRRGYADDIESLGRAGATPAQMDRLLREFAQVDPVSAKMILARDRYRHQRAAVTNPQDVAAIRKEFLAKHTRSNEKHGTVGAVESLPNLVAKYGEQSVKDMGYFARQKQILSHPRVIKDALEQSFLGNVRYTGKPTKWGKFKEIGKQVGVVESGVAHNLKLIEELNRVGKILMDYRFNIRDIRERERGGSALGNATIANMLKSMPTRSSRPYRGQAALTPIKLPTNPLSGIRGLAEQFVKERALSQAGNIGSVISRSNVMKQISRAANRNTPAVTPPPINFPSRGTHPVNLRDRFMSSSIGRYLGSKSDQVKRVGESVGFGLGTGALGYGAFQLANIGSQVIGSFGSEIARMVMGFKSGGSVPRFDGGGDPWEDIKHLSNPKARCFPTNDHSIYRNKLATSACTTHIKLEDNDNYIQRRFNPDSLKFEDIQVLPGNEYDVIDKNGIPLMERLYDQYSLSTNPAHVSAIQRLSSIDLSKLFEYHNEDVDLFSLRPMDMLKGIIDKNYTKNEHAMSVRYDIRAPNLIDVDKRSNVKYGKSLRMLEKHMFSSDPDRKLIFKKYLDRANSLIHNHKFTDQEWENVNVLDLVRPTLFKIRDNYSFFESTPYADLDKFKATMLTTLSDKYNTEPTGMFTKGMNNLSSQLMEQVNKQPDITNETEFKEFKKSIINKDGKWLIDPLTGEHFYDLFKDKKNLIAPSHLGKPTMELLANLRGDLYNSGEYNKMSIGDVSRDTHFWDKYINEYSDLIDFNKLKGMVLHRGMVDKSYPGNLLEEIKSGFINPDPAYQFMSGHQSVSDVFANNQIGPDFDFDEYPGKSVMLKHVIDDNDRNRIGFLGTDEFEFILGRNAGWNVDEDLGNNVFKVSPFYGTRGEWAFNKFAKNIPTRALGGDTFNTPLAQGMNSQIATDAVKRLQLLRIRAQAGNRLKNLRQDAQLNMQMGNTSLFRSPETASGIINSRVLNNLSSIFSGQKGQKFALGGDIPGFKNGTTPFNFRHFNIGRNSKYIKDMYNAIAPFRNDSDGQYQMFRAIENKKMGPKDFGLLSALNGMDPVSALSYQSDGSGIEMTDLGTHPAFQGKGLATSLIGKMFDVGQNKGIDTAYWSAKDDASASFYNHLGAKNEGDGAFSFDLNSWKGRFAKGGGLSSLSNPIRVSDGELAISRGMVDRIGLDTLRKINSGDVSAAFGKGFARGGIFEYDGPGTGTSDSILEDADKGPRGKDASDIGFIIKRSSSDKLKGLLGGGFSKLSGIRGFYGGGNPFGGDIGAFESKLNDVLYDPSTPNNMRKYTGKNVQKVIKLAFANNPAGDAQDIFKAVLTSNFNGSKQGRYLEAVAGNKKDGYANIGDNIDALKGVLEDVFQQQFDIPTMDFSSVTKGSNQFAQALQIATKALDSATQSIEKNNKETKRNTQNTIDDTRRQKEHTDTIKDATGTYRGQLDYVQMRGSRFGETDVTDLVEGGPNNPPTRDELLSQGMGPRNTGGITGWWNRNLAGMGSRFMQQLMSPTAMQYRVQSNIEMPIGAVGYTTEQQRDTLAANRAEYNNQRNDILERFRNEFGDILGDLNIEDLVKVTQGTKMEKGQIQTGEEIVPDPKNPEGMPLKVPIMQDITYEVGTTEVNATALEDKLRGKMSADEYRVRAERAMQPSDRSRQGLQETIDGKTVETIKAASVQTASFHEQIKKVNMTQTGLYKMGDILRGVSWRFASLGMSAMGVYFSIQGLVMTFQQGIGSIITPLSDVEALFKSIGMSTAFGDGIYNASEAMKDMGVNQESLIEGWKNLTNMQGTIQTFFASIGAKVFGDKDFTNNILNKIAEAFEVLGSDKSIETFQNLIKAVVDSLPAIIPAIQSITAMLQWIADNPVLIQWGAQLMMISLILQPIASGLAAIVTIGGGFFTIANLFATTAGALGEVAIASKTAGMGMAFMASSAARLLVISSGLLIAYELIANTLNMIGVSSAVGGKFGMSNFQLLTITGMLLPGNQGGYANGGEITGQRTAAIDDKTINVEEGEFVVKRDVAQKNKDKLKQFNSTGVWPGDEKKVLGGFIGSSAAMSGGVEQTFQANQSLQQMSDIVGNTRSTEQLVNSASDSDAFRVNVLNWPDTWGSESGNGNELPFDIGYPYHLNINTAFGNGLLPTVPRSVEPSPTPAPNYSTVPGVAPTQTEQPTETPNPVDTATNPNGQSTTPTTTATDSIVTYIGQIINGAFDSVVEVVQNGAQAVHDAIIGLVDGIHKAGATIADAAGAIGQSLGNLSAAPIIKFLNGDSGAQGTNNLPSPVINPIGFRGGNGGIFSGLTSTDYEDLVYHHGGYTPLSGTPTDYWSQSSKRSGYRNNWEFGRNLPQGALPPNMRGGDFTAPNMREIWSNKQIWGSDFPYDYGEVGRALTTGDPYQVALSVASMRASNAIVGAAGKGLQYGALRTAGTGVGWGLSRVGAGFSQMNMAGGNPLVFAGAHYLESGQAFDEWAAGRSSHDLKTGEFNGATGLLTGGFSTAGFGKGMEMWGSIFGLDDDQMRERVNANKGLFEVGIGPGKIFSKAAEGLGFGDEYESFFTQLKGGNEAVSEKIKELSKNIPIIGEGVGEFIGGLNEGIYDAIGQLANLDVGTLFGAGTSVLGIGAGAVETAGNTANMISQNPWTAAQMYMTTGMAGLPIPGMSLLGPFLANALMPQTTQWMQDQGYGQQDVNMDGIREILADPFVNQLPSALSAANEPVVSSVDLTTLAIVDGNVTNASYLEQIASNTANPTIVVQQATQQAQQALATGGVIGGKNTSAIDDKLIAGEEGEFVVRKDVAQKYGAQLHALNSTGKWPKGYMSGGFLGTGTNLKNIANSFKGDKNVYKLFQDTILKDILESGKQAQTLGVAFTEGESKAFENSVMKILNGLPDDFTKALQTTGKILNFSSDPTFGGTYKGPSSLLEKIGMEGKINFGKVADNIFAKAGLFTGKANPRTVIHEATHSLYNAASPESRNAFAAGAKKLGYMAGTDSHKTTRYLNRPTEIAAFASESIKNNGLYKSIENILNKKITFKVPNIDLGINKAIDDFMSKSIKIKTPSLSSIERPFVETFNKVGNAIDNAVKKGGEVFAKKASTIDPTSKLAVDMSKVYKDGYGLAIKDATKTSSTMFLPTDFQEESKKFAQLDYQNNPYIYHDMWNRGESGIAVGSPIEQLITNLNADVGKFIYGDRDYLKVEREAYLGNQQNTFAGIDNDTIIGVYDFKAAIEDATKAIDTSKWEWMGVDKQTTGVDTSGWTWGYNNSEIERQRILLEQQMNAPMLRYQDLEEGSKTYGKEYTMPNMDSGWWTVNTDLTHGAYSEAQKALNDAYIGKYGGYITDPNGNKYGVGGGSAGNNSKYYGDYSKTHPPPEYNGEVPEWSEGGISVGSKEPRYGIGTFEMGMNESNISSYVQSPAGSIQQQQQLASTTSNQSIIVQLTVSGEELATKRYIEVEVPNIVRQYAPQR